MLKLFYRLSGTDYQVIKLCSPDTRAKYGNLVFALFLTTLLSFIGGGDVARQFTGNLVVILLVAFLWALAVFSFDYFLINGGNVHAAFKLIRIPVGISNIAITVTALLIMLNQSTIDNKIRMGNTLAVTACDSSYQSAKEHRYADYNDGLKRINAYHNQNCLREAANGYPGPKYTLLHAVCIQTNKHLEGDRRRLDSMEVGYRNSWQLKRDTYTAEQSNDFFAKAEMLPPIITAHPVMKYLIIAMVIFLFYIELQAILLKFSISRLDDYHTNLAKHQENENEHAAASLKTAADLKREARERDVERNKLDSRRNAYYVELAGVRQSVLMQYEMMKMLGILKEKGFDVTKLLEMKGRYLPGNGPQAVEDVASDIFYMSTPMQAAVTQVMETSEPESLRMALFEWVRTFISYDAGHDKKFCRTAVWTFHNRMGICTEQAVLLMAFCRFVGLNATFCEVTVDEDGKAVNHACVTYKNAAGQDVLMDTVYGKAEAAHHVYKLLTDNELSVKFKNWNT
jgi:hypothetical protein